MTCSREIWRQHKDRQRAYLSYTVSINTFAQNMATIGATMRITADNMDRIFNYTWAA